MLVWGSSQIASIHDIHNPKTEETTSEQLLSEISVPIPNRNCLVLWLVDLFVWVWFGSVWVCLGLYVPYTLKTLRVGWLVGWLVGCLLYLSQLQGYSLVLHLPSGAFPAGFLEPTWSLQHTTRSQHGPCKVGPKPNIFHFSPRSLGFHDPKFDYIIFFRWVGSTTNWMFPKIVGKLPQIIHGLIGFSMIFTIHFGGFPPIFGNTHMELWGPYK